MDKNTAFQTKLPLSGEISPSEKNELGECLRAISCYSKLLRQEYRGRVLDGVALEYLDFIVEGSVRIQSLLENITQRDENSLP